jgi:HD-GYP domain-containing protein (c-di-GMP phosphodiesterase class II)
LAKWHGFPKNDLIPIALAGVFHDIGNVKIDSAILEKPTRLTQNELEKMKKHTLYGYQIIKTVSAVNEGVRLSVLQHHEREDGSGYPLGLKGDAIHPYAKVIAIADIFHAMTSQRQHKKPLSGYLVLEQLFNESFGKLDPAMVQTFIQKVTQFHNGTLVKLNDNAIGEIVFTDRAHPTRPMINVNGTIINLATERSLYIKEIVRSL